MPRKKPLRRFDPFFGVGRGKIDAEAKWLASELDNYLLLSANDLAKMRVEQHANSAMAWKSVQNLIAKLSDRERSAVQAALFRDILHLLELYRSYLTRAECPFSPAAPSLQAKQLEFSDWLFA